MKHVSLLPALGLLLFAGCGKDGPEATKPVLDGEYENATYTLPTAPITMYTRNGPVNNPVVVDRFLSRWAYSHALFSRADLTSTAIGRLTLTIQGNKLATFRYLSSGRPDTSDITTQAATYFVATKRDSTSFQVPAGAPNRCEALATQMPLVSPAKRCVSLPPATGYTQSCAFRPVQVVKINSGQLSIPWLTWTLHAGPAAGSTCTWTSSGSWNLFNPAVLSQLAAGDTLVVQERTIALVKK